MAGTMLAACSSSGGDWPNLSDPPPDPSDRERELEPSQTADVIPGVKPAAPERPTMTGAARPEPTSSPAPTSIKEAGDLLEDIKKTLREETLLYRETKARLAEAEGAENLQDAWFAAQLALTRLSRTASRLDDIKSLEMPDIAQAALSESEIIDRFVVGERQYLMSSDPKNGTK